MEKHHNLTDTEFETKFANCELNPTDFTHEAHLRLAWIHISKYGIKSAEENIQNQLKQFVELAGAKDKYNKTLTIAAIKSVYHFILESNADNFNDFISEFPQLKNSFKKLISSHYGIDIFNSQKAKTEYIKPDLIPFD